MVIFILSSRRARKKETISITVEILNRSTQYAERIKMEPLQVERAYIRCLQYISFENPPVIAAFPMGKEFHDCIYSLLVQEQKIINV